MKGPEAPRPKARGIGEALAHAAKGDAGATFVELDETETSFSWAQVHERAAAMAGAIRGLGIARGDRVAIVAPTSIGFLDAFFGVTLAGAVPVPLYPPFRLGRLDEYHASTARLITTAGASLVLADARARRLLGQAVERAAPRLGCHTIDDLAGEKGAPIDEPGRDGELALIQFSSGSTSSPKPVALSHENVMAQCAALYEHTSSPEGARHACATWLPLYHDMGLIGCLLGAVYYPGPIALIAPEHFLGKPALWLRAIGRHRATIAPAPNFAYALCEKRIKDSELTGIDLSAWAYALCGAEPVAADTLRAFGRRFAAWGFDERALSPVYGLAEATLAVTFPPPRRGLRALGIDANTLAREGLAVPPGDASKGREIVSVGAPLAGVEVEIRRPDGKPASEREAGRVFVKGPAVTRGYFENIEATRVAFDGAWLDTGDVGFVESNELFLCGRAKDVVIIRGANHAPHEFEDAISLLAGAREGCAVAIGVTSAEHGSEELVVLLERASGARREGDDDLATRARKALVEKTGVRPYDVRVLEPGTLPRTSSGKLRRSEAARLYALGELRPPKRVTMPRVVAEIAKSSLSFARTRLARLAQRTTRVAER